MSRCQDPAWSARYRDYLLGTLPAEATASLEAHLAGCPSCAERVSSTERGIARLERDVSVPPRSDGIWSMLARRGLTPVPAMLVAGAALLLAAYPAVRWFDRDRPGSPSPEREGAGSGSAGAAGPRRVEEERAPAGEPKVFVVYGEPEFRGQEASGPAQAAPLEIPVTADGVVLEIHTDLSREEIAESGVDARLEIRLGSKAVWSRPVPPDSLDATGVVRLPLEPGRLETGRIHVLALSTAEGDLFRRRIVAIRDASPPR